MAAIPDRVQFCSVLRSQYSLFMLTQLVKISFSPSTFREKILSPFPLHMASLFVDGVPSLKLLWSSSGVTDDEKSEVSLYTTSHIHYRLAAVLLPSLL